MFSETSIAEILAEERALQGLPVAEAWSDAARAASIAARRAKVMGKNWKTAARSAFRVVVQKQGIDPRDLYRQAAAIGGTGSFNVLPRGTTGAAGIFAQATRRAAPHKVDRDYWAARRGHIQSVMTRRAARFA